MISGNMWPGKEPSAGEIRRSRYNSLLRKHLYRHPAAWLSAHGAFFPDQRFLVRASNIDQDPNTVRTLHTDSSTKDNVLIRVPYTCRQGSSRNSKKNTRSRTSTRPSPGTTCQVSVLVLTFLFVLTLRPKRILANLEPNYFFFLTLRPKRILGNLEPNFFF